MSDLNLQNANIKNKNNSKFFNSTFIYLILMLLFVGVRIFAQYGLLDFFGEYTDLIFSLIIQAGVIFGVSFLLYKKLNHKTVKEIFKDFKFVKISWKSVLICVILGVLLIILNIAFNSIYDLILQIFGYERPTGSPITSYSLPAFLIAIFSTAMLPAFCEEFANRGMLLKGLSGLGMKKAIIISGLIFGLMHLNISQFGYAFLIGMFFAFLVYATGSIWPGIILHFMNNGMSEYLTFASVNKLPLSNFYGSISSLLENSNYFASILLIFMILLTVIFIFAWLTYLLIKDTRGRKMQELGDDLAKTFENQPPELRPKTLKIDIPLSAIGINVKQIYKPTFKEKIPLVCLIFLGTVITIMTLIWSTL